MKTRLILALSFLALQAAQATVYTYTDSWDILRNTTLFGTQTAETLSSKVSYGSLSLPFYTGTEKLIGVQIIYSAPLGANPDTMTGSLTDTVGTTSHLDSSSIYVETAIGSSTLFNGLKTIDATTALSFYSTTNAKGFTESASDAKGASVLTSPGSVDFSLTRNYSDTVLNTSNPAMLAYFTKSGSFGLQLDSTVVADYSRGASDTGTLTFATSGYDSGTVEVIYTTEGIPSVPEPSVIFGVGFLALMVFGGVVREKIKLIQG